MCLIQTIFKSLVICQSSKKIFEYILIPNNLHMSVVRRNFCALWAQILCTSNCMWNLFLWSSMCSNSTSLQLIPFNIWDGGRKEKRNKERKKESKKGRKNRAIHSHYWYLVVKTSFSLLHIRHKNIDCPFHCIPEHGNCHGNFITQEAHIHLESLFLLQFDFACFIKVCFDVPRASKQALQLL